MKTITLFVLLGTGLTVLGQNGGISGLEIAEKYDQAYSGWVNYTTTSTMVLKNQHGQESKRELVGKNLEQEIDGDKSMIIFNSPKDVKGTAVLTFTHKEGADDQWLFLPAINRVKRIASNNKSGPFVGSEFAYEDLSSQEIEKYTYKFLKEELSNGEKYQIVERDPVDPKSGYKNMHVWYNTGKNYRIEKVVFFDRKGSKFKTLVYKHYRKYLDQYWYPGELHMVNHQTKKETRILFHNYQFKRELDDNDFTQVRLKNAR